jgi:hypothetical protein
MYCDRRAECWNHENATDTLSEITGHVSMVMYGQQWCFLLVDPDAIMAA